MSLDALLKINFEGDLPENPQDKETLTWDLLDIGTNAKIEGAFTFSADSFPELSNWEWDYSNFLTTGELNLTYRDPNVVPEPSTIALLLLGTVSLGIWGRKRSVRKH
ncbi:MAG: PEP-CTERM sorting domain-containing protein [Planctomycetia bacterium]|nr:PEP-CTERM sorting domain-containing protein [Planctomycetia bacterium]